MIILDLSIASLLVLLLIFMMIEYEIFGFQQFLSIPYSNIIANTLLWIIISLSVLDLYIKYKASPHLSIFLKKHKLDIFVVTLFPLFAIFKMIKISIKLYKIMKIVKTNSKIGLYIKKFFKNKY